MEKIPFEEDDEAYEARDIIGPRDICQNEWLRRKLGDQVEWGTPVPMDVFVMGDGEPEDRTCTKIGGLPYLSKTDPWPLSDSGKPLQFVGQFNFCDSRDIAEDIDGDILLVFSGEGDGCYEDTFCLWKDEDIASEDLVDSTPEFEFPIKPTHGYRVRVNAFPDAEFKKTDEDGAPLIDGKPIRSDYWLKEYQATQIGSAPFNPQGHYAEEETEFLCAFASILQGWRAEGVSYPWVNVEQPAEDFSEDYLMIGDMGCLFLAYDDDGELGALNECY